MDLVDKLRSQKIRVLEIPKWGPYLRKQWENHFASHLDLNEKSAIHMYDSGWFCGYLWHLFSYKRKDCLEGEKAIEAFNQEFKKDCYLFYQHSDYALLVENADAMNFNHLVEEIGEDIYIVDKEFRWTFVMTHETDYCGPYFSRG